MNINQQIKKQLRWKNSLFIFFFLSTIALCAWLSLTYEFEADWTNNKRNTVSEATQALLEKVDSPISIQTVISPNNKALKADIQQLIQSYQRIKPNITLTFLDPALKPALMREFGIRNDGELIIRIDDQEEHIVAATEKNITNAIQRLARTQDHWLLFLEGHDERSPYGDTSFDYSSWYTILKNKGLMVRSYNLANNPNIPYNTAALVIADPQKPLLDGEVKIITQYIAQGGNLLWLLEPGNLQNMEEIAESLGIETIPGMIVDPNSQLLGLNDPRFTVIPEYPRNIITQNLDSMTIFPTAQAFEVFENKTWATFTLLETLSRTWAETQNALSNIMFNSASDTQGPLTIGISLTRSITTENADIDVETDMTQEEPNKQNHQQRIVIIGDSDFPSDAYLGQAGNLDLSMSIINWLVKEDAFINIPNRTNIDNTLDLSKSEQIFIGFSFLLFLPLSLMLTGLFIWFKRRKS